MANILVLYHRVDPAPLRGTVREHLYSFRKYTSHNYRYINVAASGIPAHLMSEPVDLVVFHTIFFGPRWGGAMKKTLDRLRAPLARLGGVRIMLPQDEFHRSAELVEFVNDFKIDHIFSVAPETEWPKIYAGVDRSVVQIHKVLTGYLDDDTVAHIAGLAPTERQRTIDVGYRAWGARPWVGRHGMLKTEIAEVFNKRAPERGLKCDVSVRAEDTLYGDDWLRFLLRSRYTIGVEGGSSLLDLDGSILTCVERYLRDNPAAPFDDVEEHCFQGLDGKLKLFALSPRHFEACATRTGQVLIEGDYDGVLVADRHYIPLKADFSNIDAVLDRMMDEESRQQMTRITYEEIVASAQFTYRRFVQFVLEKSLGTEPLVRPAGLAWRIDPWIERLATAKLRWKQRTRATGARLTPAPIRRFIRRVFNRALDRSQLAADRIVHPETPRSNGSVPMKICMLLADAQLTDTRVTNEATALSRAGYDVTIVMIRMGREHEETCRDGFRVRMVPPLALGAAARLRLAATRPWQSRLARAEAVYLRQRTVTGSIAPVASGSGATPGAVRPMRLRSLRWLFPLRPVFEALHGIYGDAAFAHETRRLRPDVVHAHDTATLRVANHVARQIGASVVYDAHELFAEQGGLHSREAHYWRRIETTEVPAADLVLTVNEFLAEELVRRHRIDRVHVVHNAAPWTDHSTGRDDARAILGRRLPSATECILLYLGGLRPGRGVEELLSALALLPSRFGLVVMGDGSHRPVLEHHARAVGVDARVAWLGMVPRENVPPLAVGADIGLVTQKETALNERLCSPNRISDYLNAGLALGLSDLPFLRQFVTRHGCGITFEPTPEGIATALLRFDTEPDLLPTLRRRALVAARTFNWESESERLIAAYASLTRP